MSPQLIGELAQLARAPALQAGGRRFESVILHKFGSVAELVDCTGLENRRAARHRGFESLRFRKFELPRSLMVEWKILALQVNVRFISGRQTELWQRWSMRRTENPEINVRLIEVTHSVR